MYWVIPLMLCLGNPSLVQARNSIGIELSPAFAELAARRLQQLSLIPEGLTIEQEPPPTRGDDVALSLLDHIGGI